MSKGGFSIASLLLLLVVFGWYIPAIRVALHHYQEFCDFVSDINSPINEIFFSLIVVASLYLAPLFLLLSTILLMLKGRKSPLLFTALSIAIGILAYFYLMGISSAITPSWQHAKFVFHPSSTNDAPTNDAMSKCYDEINSNFAMDPTFSGVLEMDRLSGYLENNLRPLNCNRFKDSLTKALSVSNDEERAKEYQRARNAKILILLGIGLSLSSTSLFNGIKNRLMRDLLKLMIFTYGMAFPFAVWILEISPSDFSHGVHGFSCMLKN